jgi:hypothetical protein
MVLVVVATTQVVLVLMDVVLLMNDDPVSCETGLGSPPVQKKNRGAETFL